MNDSSNTASRSAFWLVIAALVLLLGDNLLAAWFDKFGRILPSGEASEYMTRFYQSVLLFDGYRLLMPLVVLGLLIATRRLKRADVGLVLGNPRQSLFWIVMPAAIAGLVGATMALVLSVLGWTTFLRPTEIWFPFLAGYYFLHGCILCPLMEEAIYRGALVPAVERTTGSWIQAVICSSLAFTGIHLVAGRPPWTMPVYLFGGALMAWAFVKSRSLLAPILLHSLGNMVVLAKDLIALHSERAV